MTTPRYDPRYSAFLASCVDAASREPTPEEIADAEQVLREKIAVPQFDLILGEPK